MIINSNQLIQQLAADLKQVIDDTNHCINSVSDTALLNLPEADKKWSMLQCTAHMSLSVKVYVQNIGNALKKNEMREGTNYEFKSDWKADRFTRIIAPDANAIIKNRMRTMKSMQPQKVLSKEATLQEFNDLHRQLLVLLEQSGQYDLNRIKVATALGPILKFRMGDAFRFVIAHAQRHVVQLKRIHQNLPVPA